MKALFDQTGRYLSFVAWFFKDALVRYRGRLVLLVVANIAGIALQALGVLIAYRYASAVESGKAIAFAGFALEPRESLGLLAAAAVSVFLVLSVAGFLVMRARVEGAAVALDYGEYCSQRIYYLASRLPFATARDGTSEYTRERLMELARRDPHYCALVLRIMAYALRHVGTAAVAGVALLVIDFYLTLVVVATFAVAALFLRRASIRGASQRSRLQRHAPEKARDRRLLEERVARNPAPLSPNDVALQEVFSEGGAAKYRAAELAQRRALEGGRLIAQIAMGFALFLVLLVHGSATLREASNWSALLAYVAALSFFGMSMARLGRLLVSINRFYPPLARHARFVETAERELATGQGGESGPYCLDASWLGDGGPRALEIQKGDRLALALPDEVSRYSLIPLVNALQPLRRGSDPARIAFPWFAGSAIALGGGSLRENLGLPTECSLQDLGNEVAPLQSEDASVRLPSSIDRMLTDREREALTPSAIFLLMAVSGLLNRRPVLVLEHTALATLAPEVRHLLLEKSSTCITFIAYRADRIERVGECGESTVIIAGGEAIFGWTRTDILLAGHQGVADALARSASDSRVARRAGLADDDFEDLE